MKLRIPLLLAILVALLLFVSSAGKAAYLSGKAVLAQLLLNQAWTNGLKLNQSIKPWPWADVHAVAKLEIPRLQIGQIALGGHSGEAMAFGPGLVERNNSFVIAGHRDSHFTHLKELRTDDSVTLTLADGRQKVFTVRQSQIFNVNDFPELLVPDNSLVLLTCYPFDAINAGGPLRYMVTAY